MRRKSLLLAILVAAIVAAGCVRNESISVKPNHLYFPQEAGNKTIEITADCNWSVSITEGADWFTVSPMSGGEVEKGAITVTVQQSPTGDLRRGSFTITSAKGKATAEVKVTQNLLSLTNDNLWFDHNSQTKTIWISADCDWTVSKDDGADWYEVYPMSGGKCSHEPLEISTTFFEGPNFRESSFTVSSTDGELAIKVRLSQNIIEIESLENTIFVPLHIEHWNTDFYGMLIEDSYNEYNNADPYDTISTGYVMYFKENSQGLQKDYGGANGDTIYYYPFEYRFDLASRLLEFDFETPEEGEIEDYDVTVLTATNEVFRFEHQYRDHTWEMAALTKIGDIDPSAPAKGHPVKSVFSKRKGRGPIFKF